MSNAKKNKDKTEKLLEVSFTAEKKSYVRHKGCLQSRQEHAINDCKKIKWYTEIYLKICDSYGVADLLLRNAKRTGSSKTIFAIPFGTFMCLCVQSYIA